MQPYTGLHMRNKSLHISILIVSALIIISSQEFEHAWHLQGKILNIYYHTYMEKIYSRVRALYSMRDGEEISQYISTAIYKNIYLKKI